MTPPRAPRLPARRLLVALLLLGHALLALGFAVVSPLAEAPDEADHWAYVAFVARERRLPDGAALTEAKQPPLYYLGATVLAGLARPGNEAWLRSNPDGRLSPPGAAECASPADESPASWPANSFIHTTLEQWPWRGEPLAFHLARLWSVLLSTATVAVVYLALRLAFPGRPALALGTSGLLAFLPELAFIGGAVSNDNGAALLGALALWGSIAIYRRGGRGPATWLAGLALGLGFLTKINLLGLWPVAGLAVLLGALAGWEPPARRWRRAAQGMLAVYTPAVAVAGLWLLRNWQLYGDPLGWSLVRQSTALRSAPWTWQDTLWLLGGWFRSGLGKFGAAGHIPLPTWLYGVALALFILSVLGLGVQWGRLDRAERAGLLILLAAGLATMITVWRSSLLVLGTDQGRLLFPAAGALLGLVVLGLLAWLPAPRQLEGALAITLLSLALGLFALLGVVRPTFAPPPTATPPPVAQPITMGGLTLQGLQLSPQPVLYWQASGDRQDWRVHLRLLGEDGAVLWEHKRSPGAGRWSSDHWPASYTTRDAYCIPWQTLPAGRRYRLDVAVYPFGGNPAQAPVDLGRIER